MGTADIQFLSISDWHGQIDPIGETAAGVTTNYGGLGVLSAYFAADRAANPLTLTFTAGDAFGASPPLVSQNAEKPAVESLDFLKVDADTFGNHNFDQGTAALKTLIDSAKYKYVSTNLTNVSTELGTKVVTPYHLIDVGAGGKLVRVAILGITNADAPSLVFPGRLGTITISDAVAAAKSAATDARKAGANVVVALAHIGATAVDASSNPTGPLIDFAASVTGVDVILGDHTDQIVNGKFGSAWVLENRSKGRTYGRVTVKVDKGAVVLVNGTIVNPIGTYSFAQGAITQTSASTCASGGACPTGYACNTTNHACEKTCTMGSDCDTGFSCAMTGSSGKCTRPKLCTADVTCPDTTWTCSAAGKCEKPAAITADPAAETVLKPYRDALGAKFDATLGKTDDVFVRDGSLERSQEAPIGDLVADAMLDRYKSVGAQIAFTNGGGLRSSWPSSYTPATAGLVRTGCSAGTPCDLVVGDVYALLPFGNVAVVRTITGEQLWSVLEYSVGALPAISGRFLQIAGFKFEAKVGNASGSRITKVQLADGTDIPNSATVRYKVVTNDFTNAGGDGYTMLKEATPSAGLAVLADIVAAYVKGRTLSPATYTGRITLTP